MGVRRGRGYLVEWRACGRSVGRRVVCRACRYPPRRTVGSEAGVQEYLIPGTQAQLLGVFNRLLADIYGAGNACVSTAAGDCVSAAGELRHRHRVAGERRRLCRPIGAAPRCGGQRLRGGLRSGSLRRRLRSRSGPGHHLRPGRYGRARGIPPPVLSAFSLSGGDRIVTVGGPVLVMRAAWPRWIRFPVEESFGVSVGRILAESLTLYPTGAWGSGYGSPMGVLPTEDPFHVDDRTTLALVQASEDATVVSLNGAPVGTLPRGGSLLIDPVPVGAFIGGSGPIAVSLVTSGGEQVDVRAFNLTPPGLLGSTYVLPANSTVAGDDRALDLRLYLYAYEPLDYGVYQGSEWVAGGTLGGAGATAVHAIGGATEVPLPEAAPDPGPESSLPLAGGLRVEATGRLQVLAAFDSDRPDWDWGFPLVGAGHLANEYFVPVGAGTWPGLAGHERRRLPGLRQPLAREPGGGSDPGVRGLGPLARQRRRALRGARSRRVGDVGGPGGRGQHRSARCSGSAWPAEARRTGSGRRTARRRPPSRWRGVRGSSPISPTATIWATASCRRRRGSSRRGSSTSSRSWSPSGCRRVTRSTSPWP